MPDESNAPKKRHRILRRIRLYGLTLASVVVIIWAALIAFKRYPQLSDWELPLTVVVAAILAIAVLWKIPQWQVDKLSGLEPKERFDRVNEARRTLAQIVGGAAVLAGFYSTVQNLNVNREGQITDRFTKAIEQLGAVDSSGMKKLGVRLGGIYALERIANESITDHWPIMEVLTAYVRDNAPAEYPHTVSNDKPATDIQAILTVLGRRNTESELFYQSLDLHKTDLRGADLRRAHLKYADLSGADLRRADLNRAALTGVNFDGAHLSGANLSLADLTLVSFVKADLSGANLRWVDLNGAHLDYADLSRADLRGASFIGVNLQAVNLSGADLGRADLSRAEILDQQQIDSAKGDMNTQLPSNIHMPEAWKKH